MRRTPIRAMSPRRRRENRERAKLRVRLYDERGPWCQAGLAGCDGRWSDMHEVLARSAGGAITDPENILCVCRRCHEFITTEPEAAMALGLRRSRYDGGDAA